MVEALGFGGADGYPTLELITERLDKRGFIPDGECLLFNGKPMSRGYGKLAIQGKEYYAHRLALEVKLQRRLLKHERADHACGIRLCVNRDHLRAATNADNIAYRVGLNSNNTSGERNVYWYPPGGKWRTAVVRKGKAYGHYHSEFDDAVKEARMLRAKLFPLGEFGSMREEVRAT